MKKIFIVLMLLVAASTVNAKCFAYSAWNQAQDTDYYGNSAAHSSSDEDARAKSGCGFDTSCGSSTVVDLRDKGEHPTVQLFDRDAYVPQKYKSVKPSYVPPMP